MTSRRLVGLLMLVILACSARAHVAAAAPSPFEVRLQKQPISRGKGWEVEIKYPSMASKARPAVAAAFNREVRSRLDGYVADFKKFIREEGKRVGQPVTWFLHLSYEPPVVRGDFVSIIMAGESYTGGAHGSHPVDTILFDARRGRVLALRDLFRPGSAWLARVSRICIDELKKRGLEASTVEDGAGPKEKNFKCFTLDAGKLVITFPEYQVGPYVAGPQQVEIPASKLRDIAAPGGPLAR